MKRITMVLGGVVVLAAAATLLWASGGKADSSKPPEFESDDFKYRCMEYHADSKLVYPAKAGGTVTKEHSFEMKGSVEVPKDSDVVCVSEKLKVTAADNDEGKSILSPENKSSGELKFNAVAGTVGKCDVAKVKLTANAYTLAKVTAECEAVLAEDRADVDLANKIMDRPVDVGHSHKLRISAMTLDKKRHVEVTVEITRPDGRTSPFLEAVYAVSASGKEIGGGRWNSGQQTFGATGAFKSSFDLTTADEIDHFKCVLVTKYKVEKLTFTLDGVFQQ